MTSWIFPLMASSTGHSDLPYTSSPRTGRKKREKAFILQGWKREPKDPQLGQPLPILGRVMPTEHVGSTTLGPCGEWGWRPRFAPSSRTRAGGGGDLGAAVTYRLSRLSRPNLGLEFHAAATSPSLRPLGVGLPVLVIPPFAPGTSFPHLGPRGSLWSRLQGPNGGSFVPLFA